MQTVHNSPSLGRHDLYFLEDLLSLALEGSTLRVTIKEKITALMKNIEGTDCLISDETELPRFQLQNILLASFYWPNQTRHLFVADKVSRLSVFYYRTSSANALWNPTLESRLDFVHSNQGAISWQDSIAFPNHKYLFKWLLTK